MGLIKSYREADYLLSFLKAETIVLNKKEKIFEKEQSSEIMGLVLEGMVYLCAEDESLDRNILQFFRPGDVFSGNALFNLGSGTGYYITKTTSKIAFFTTESLLSYCLNNPQTAGKLALAMLSSSNRLMIIHNHILQQKTIRRKLQEFFRQECAYQRSSRIELPIPFSDLSEYLAVDRTSMMKELGKMKDDGLISGNNHKLTINFYQYLR